MSEPPTKIQDLLNLKEENENLRTQLKEFRITDSEVENELDSMKRILMAEIREERFPDKIKRHFQLYFGIPAESPEKLQLDQLMLNQDNRFRDQKADCKDRHLDEKLVIDKRFHKIEQMVQILKYAVIAIGVAFGVPEVLRLFGLG